MLVLVAVVLVGVGIAANRSSSTPSAALTLPTSLVGAPDAESTSWYCTGQTTSSGSASGYLMLSNTTTASRTATIAAVSDTSGAVQTAVAIPARDTVVPTVPGLSGSFESQTVTLSGGGVAVSQVLHGAAGWTEAPCQSTTADAWYFTGGTTDGSALLSVSLLNPTSTPVVVDLAFGTSSGTVHPINYQGIVLEPGQVQTVDVSSEVQNQPEVSTTVTTRTGRVVATELQQFSGGLALLGGTAFPQSHWAIPQSQEVPGGSSVVDVFNPGTTPEHVTVHLRLGSGPLHPLAATVAPDSTWTVATSAQTRIPDDATYATDIEATGGAGVVVARRVAAPSSATAPQVGSAPAVDGLSQDSPTDEWVVPPAATTQTSPVSGAGPRYLALVNTSAAVEHFSAFAVGPTRSTLLGTGALAAGGFVVMTAPSDAVTALEQVVVRADGPMAVSQDLQPSGTVGVVSMPGVPLAATIGL
jgi:hypothetical protein